RGFAMASPATQSAVLTSVAVEPVGKASGALNMIRQLGGAFGVAVQVAVSAAAGSYPSADAFIARRPAGARRLRRARAPGRDGRHSAAGATPGGGRVGGGGEGLIALELPREVR